MGKKLLLIAGFIVLASNSVVKSITLSSRRFASCGFMSGKIYCYGGQTSAVQSDTVDNNLYFLDIAQFSGQTIESINNNWELVVPSKPFDTEFRRNANAIVLADGKRLFIHGGYGDEKTRYVNQTIIYDTTINTWQSVSPYTEGSHGIRQIYSAAVVNLPNGDVGLYGGFEQLGNAAVPFVTASGKTIKYWSDDNGTFVGFTSMQLYSPVTASWKTFNAQKNIPTDYYFQTQTATLDPVSGKVYFLGGTFYTLNEENILVTFDWAHTFNTNSGSWLNETLFGKISTGKDIPTPRHYHTADLLPNSRDIIVYGGTKGDVETGTASIDYCFTLNLISNTWTEQTNLNIPADIGGPRFAHSSVLVNTTLLITFGKGVDSTFQHSLIAIDVSNVENISYSATFGTTSDPGAPSGSSTSSGSANPSNDGIIKNSSSSLSKGAIGGIAAGASAAGLAIIAAILWAVYRKRKSEESNDSNEKMQVDWNRIDNHYREVSPVNWGIPPNLPSHSENLSSSSKTETYSQSFSPNIYANDFNAVNHFDADGNYYVVKPDTA